MTELPHKGDTEEAKTKEKRKGWEWGGVEGSGNQASKFASPILTGAVASRRENTSVEDNTL